MKCAKSKPVIASLLLGCIAAVSSPSGAQESDLSHLDLATLMNMDVTVTSAARRAQVSSDAAAAVFVITREDIRHSGATSIPDLLRFVPGIQVARIANGRWAVSARGFNSRFANKLLVLVDGRDIYTPQFSGVYWEYQQVPLSEIARIEIVCGPGGALWGANAVNGVINIITNSAAESAGLKLTGAVGNEDQDNASLHFGGAFGENNAYRAYIQHFDRASYNEAASGWSHVQSGWRVDGRTDEGSNYTLQGDVAYEDLGEQESFALDTVMKNTTASLNMNWDGASFANGRLAAQSSFSFRQSEQFEQTFDREKALDLNLQHSAPRTGRQLMTFGGGWRWQQDKAYDILGYLSFDPRSATRTQASLFAQDEIFFFSDRVRVTLGAKLEHHEYTGFAFQPTTRALWRVNEQNTLWIAYSRAIRTPSRFERAVDVLAGAEQDVLPAYIYLRGNPDIQEERLNARELGWRWRASQQLSLDLSLFDNHYDSLVQVPVVVPQLILGPPPYLLISSTFQNAARAHYQGAGLMVDWVVLPTLRAQAMGSWLLHVEAPGIEVLGRALEGGDPTKSYAFRLRNDLPFNIELDLSYRYVGAIPTDEIRAYDSVDLRLGWRDGKRWELSFTLDNLLNDVHSEMADEQNSLDPGARISRSVFFKVQWRSNP